MLLGLDRGALGGDGQAQWDGSLTESDRVLAGDGSLDVMPKLDTLR